MKIKKPSAIVCSIEGTTTSILFWKEILQPFIFNSTERCIKDTWNQPQTIDTIAMLRNKAAEDFENDTDVPQIAAETASKEEIISSAVNNVQFSIHSNRQSNELLNSILLVWLYGYENNLFKSHVYPDVMPSFKRWKKNFGIKLYTFANSDCIIQEMLFSQTLSGNLNKYIDDYFSLNTSGKKNEIKSYRSIAKHIRKNSKHIGDNIIFLSDNLKELKASHEAGLTPILVIRSHNEDLLEASQPFEHIKSFANLHFN